MNRGKRGGDYKGNGEGFAGTIIKYIWTLTKGMETGEGGEEGWGGGEGWAEKAENCI